MADELDVTLIWQDGSISHHNLTSNSHWQGGKLCHVVWVCCQWRPESMQTLFKQGKWRRGWQSCTRGSNIYKRARLSRFIGKPLSSTRSLNLSPGVCFKRKCVEEVEHLRRFPRFTPACRLRLTHPRSFSCIDGKTSLQTIYWTNSQSASCITEMAWPPVSPSGCTGSERLAS